MGLLHTTKPRLCDKVLYDMVNITINKHIELCFILHLFINSEQSIIQ